MSKAPTNSPSFSVIVPTYQRRDLVTATITSLAQNEYDGPVEIIVVVDGSVDGTSEQLAALRPRVPMRVIEQPNLGAAAARNRGAAEAIHDVLLFIDDDMIAEPDLLQQHARMYAEGADTVIGATPLHPDSAPGFLTDSTARWIEQGPGGAPLAPWNFGGQLSVRRRAFEHVGGFDETLTSDGAFANEDADLGVRLLNGFDARYNRDAVSRQIYVVTPREHMRRASRAVAGDLRFLAKHPQLTGELFGLRGLTSMLCKYVYLPLARFPFVAKALAASALVVAEAAMKTPLRSNRVVARFFSGARSVAFWSALRDRRQLPGRGRLLVLCYHSIRDLSDDPVLAPYGVPPELFAEQLDVLRSATFTFLGPDAVEAFVSHGTPLPKRAVLLTFDDCYQDLIEIARNILQPRNIPALAFAVTGARTNAWDEEIGAVRMTLLSPAQLIALQDLGIEIGSHSQTHAVMPTLDPARQASEAEGSADELARSGVRRPRFFAYPYGAHDEVSVAAVTKAGYLAAFDCANRRVKEGAGVFALPRVVIYASDRGARFKAKVMAPRWFAAVASLKHRATNLLRLARR